MITDIGISLGRIVFAGFGKAMDIQPELASLRLLGSLVVLFFVGGVVGALGFRQVGFLFTLPLAAGLLLLAAMPVIDDLRRGGTEPRSEALR